MTDKQKQIILLSAILVLLLANMAAAAGMISLK